MHTDTHGKPTPAAINSGTAPGRMSPEPSVRRREGKEEASEIAASSVKVIGIRCKMSMEIVDGGTVRSFVEDEGAFNASVDGRFAALDADHDGLLSYAEIAGELMNLRVFETQFGVDDDELAALHRGLFARFDRDSSGAVDREEFLAEMKEVMLAVASGLGFMPVQMVVEEGSLLKVAVDRELARAA